MHGEIILMGAVAGHRAALKTAGRRVVVTNGCFDLLHTGHLRYLTEARALGDFLWVGINTDEAVRVLKGANRPVHDENDRAELLAGLRVVDAVTIFPDVRALQFLHLVVPDIYAKGGDYTPETLDASEREVLTKLGSEIRILPLVPGRSTTLALKKLGA